MVGDICSADFTQEELAAEMCDDLLLQLLPYLAAGQTYSPQAAHQAFCAVFLPHL